MDDSARRSFFEWGETEIAARFAFINRIYGETPGGTAVDFGCGVGRLMIPLSRRFERVVGVDVSPAMIAEAQKNCQAFGVREPIFFRTPDEIEPNSVDFVHSSIVFQHIRPSQGLRIMEELLGKLRDKGVAALHVLSFRKLSAMKELVYQIKSHVPGGLLAFNLMQGKKLSEPHMEMNNYPLDQVLAIFIRKQMTKLVLLPARGRTSDCFVFGQREL